MPSSRTSESTSERHSAEVPFGPPDDQSCSVKLDVFEGPLDLLLHLVRRHELDILDIPISFVCEKYLEYLAFMRALDLEIAGDYLVMAATLAYLKSRELLPPAPSIDDDSHEETQGDPRAELIRRLLEYQTFRAAAEELDKLPVSGRDVFGRGASIELPPLDAGLAPITLFRLAEAYYRVLQRARVRKSHDVVLERLTVQQRMKQLSLLLGADERVEFERLFLAREWTSEQELRAMLVVTLMSILELVKLGVARVHQPEGSDTLIIERRVDANEAERLLASYEGDESALAEARMHDDDTLDALHDEIAAFANMPDDAGGDAGEPWSSLEDCADETHEDVVGEGHVVHAQTQADEPERVSTHDGTAVEPAGEREAAGSIEPTEAGEAESIDGDDGAGEEDDSDASSTPHG